ncbi:hypothetical protein BH23THE1_BH23THE1_32600 [soil metagenome]
MLYKKLIIISVVLGLCSILPTSELVTASSSKSQDFRQETLNPNTTDTLTVNDSQDFRQETLNPNTTDTWS